MTWIPRWIRPDRAGFEEPALGVALREAFAARPHRISDAVRSVDASVVLDDGTGEFWTLRIQNGHLSLREGRDRRAETTISGDPLTLAGVVRGKRSGLDSFSRGRLRVRGNVSLALKLEGIFERRSRPTDRARPRRVLANGIDTFFLDAGSGPPVVVLHGVGATNSSMLPTLAALSGRYRVLVPDLPGFGDSAKPVARYDAPFFSRWLSSFLDATGVDRAHVVGNSLGGRIAIELALQEPERVSTLALLSPALAFRRNRSAAPVVRFMAPEFGVIPVPLLRRQLHRGIRFLFARPERLPDAFYDAAVDEFIRVFRMPLGRVAFFAAARRIYLERPFGPDGFWPRLERLNRPALFLWGEADRMVPAAFARHVEAALPRARSIVLKDCGHIPQFELPEATHGAVLEFLAEHDNERLDEPSNAVSGGSTTRSE
jgi:pimeloyl-ACP methyl ester carboxylesterase/putative sterol carrier protein